VKLWRGPKSLPGQLALLVACALFVAQAINFAMLLRERRAARFGGITGSAIARLVDAHERLTSGRALPARGRGRVMHVGANPVGATAERRSDVEQAIRSGLSDAGIDTRRIIAATRPVSANDPRFRRADDATRDRLRRFGSELVIAVETPQRAWLTLAVPWPRWERGIVAQLIVQTLVLYVVVLIPLLWVGRRVARPLRTLTAQAGAFQPGVTREPLIEEGPGDVRSLIAAYNAMGRRVTTMLDEKDRMLGAIGHDLRTPLAALRVRVESVEDDQDRSRMIDTIDEMARTLEDILSLARLGRPSEQPVEVDLAALVDAVVDDFRDLGADVEAEEAPRLLMRLRPALMRRAVRNLVENAVKYAGSAEVQVRPTADGATIAVLDRGPGIPEHRLEDVFDPFVRGEASRNRDTGGIGLGLALARSIVLEAGGTLTLANRDGGGLLATISLPRQRFA
jgi:signal transduction histidine kinase